MAVPWNVFDADDERHLHCCCHLLYRHHLRPLREGDLLGDQPGAQEMLHHLRGAEHHGDPRGPEV